MTMNCERFKSMLDRYVDSELSEEERGAMEEHALSCDECAETLNQALTTAMMCAELNEGLTVPLECQAAWRRAVREEASKAKKTPGWLIWRRTLSVAAAAVALFFAIGGALNPNGLSPSASLSLAGRYSNSADYDGDYSPGAEGGARPEDAHPAAFLLESDGALETGKSVGTSGESRQSSDVVVLRSARRQIATKSFDSDILWLEDLLREYSAYFEDRTVTGQAEESAEDITANDTDVSTRLSVLRSQLDQLNAMNERAESVDDLIAIHERATELMEQIESYESTLRSWSSRANYSTVSLTVEEDVADGESATASLGERMKEAFSDSVKWLRTFGQNAAIFLAALTPRLAVWGPVAAIVIVVICLIFRRKKK